MLQRLRLLKSECVSSHRTATYKLKVPWTCNLTLNVFMERKKEYDAKVAKALNIFHDKIGPQAYDHAKRYLRASPPQLRNAFS